MDCISECHEFLPLFSSIFPVFLNLPTVKMYCLCSEEITNRVCRPEIHPSVCVPPCPARYCIQFEAHIVYVTSERTYWGWPGPALWLTPCCYEGHILDNSNSAYYSRIRPSFCHSSINQVMRDLIMKSCKSLIIQSTSTDGISIMLQAFMSIIFS